MMLSATIIFGAVACSRDEPVTAPQSSASPGPAGPPHVVFYGEGDGTVSASVTMRTETGGAIQKDVALPMVDAATKQPGVVSDRFKRGDQLYMSLQNSEAAGSVTCRIEVDGKVIDTATSSGAGVVASCRGIVP